MIYLTIISNPKKLQYTEDYFLLARSDGVIKHCLKLSSYRASKIKYTYVYLTMTYFK